MKVEIFVKNIHKTSNSKIIIEDPKKPLFGLIYNQNSLTLQNATLPFSESVHMLQSLTISVP